MFETIDVPVNGLLSFSGVGGAASPVLLQWGLIFLLGVPAQECVEYGPVSRYGLGTAYGCTAEVTWDDGEEERLECLHGQVSSTLPEEPDSEQDTGPGRGAYPQPGPQGGR